MTPNPISIQIKDATVKISIPERINNAPVAIMLHGWTGDETSMWIFANQLPETWLVIAPRAPFPTQGSDLGGFSWINRSLDIWPGYQDFIPAANWLRHVLEEVRERYPQANFGEVNLFGFSQGAAMAFVYASVNPENILKIGMLSGFIPVQSEGFVEAEAFRSKKVFIAHGDFDEIVPPKKAEDAYKFIKDRGSDPILCLSRVGHRLGAECFQEFSAFMIEG